MEVCPKCGSVFIEWNGLQGCYRCLSRKCGHTWEACSESLITYVEIKNTYLKLSLSPGQPLPRAKVATQ